MIGPTGASQTSTIDSSRSRADTRRARRPSFTVRGFHSPRESVRVALGDLERAVMDVLWRNGEESSVREVHGVLGDDLAYTTVMTTLDRLHRKGLLTRRHEGRAFLYRARLSRDEFERQMATDVIAGLLDGDAEPVVACIVDAVGEHDAALLDELDRLVRDKRKALRRNRK